MFRCLNPGLWRHRQLEGLARALIAAPLALCLLLPPAAAQDVPALGKETPAIQALIEDLSSDDPQARLRAAEALGAIATEVNAAVLPLLDAAQDEAQQVRDAAIYAIWQLGPDSVTHIIQFADPESRARIVESVQEIAPALEALQRQAGQGQQAQLPAQPPGVPGVDNAVIAELADPDPEVRRAAADSLAALQPPTPAVIVAMIEALNDDDESVREQALDYLARIGMPARMDALRYADPQVQTRADETLDRFDDTLWDRETDFRTGQETAAQATDADVSALVEALKSGDGFARLRAAEALGRAGPAAAAAAPYLIEALTGPDRSLRVAAVRALYEIGPAAKDTVPALIALLDDENAELRTEVIIALDAMGPAAAPAVPQLIPLLDDEDLMVRRAVVAALGEIGPAAKDAIPTLIAALDTQDNEIRRSAASALGAIGPAAKDAVPALIRLFGGGNEFLEMELETALEAIGPASPQAVPKLIEALSDDNRMVRQQAAEALTQQAALEQALPVLVPALKHEDPEVRADAVSALGIIAPERRETVDRLIEALSDEDEEVRRAAIGALGDIGRSADRAVPHLIDALSDANEDVRSTAPLALMEMGPAAKAALPALTQMLLNEQDSRWSVPGALVHIATELRDAGDTEALPELIAARDAILTLPEQEASELVKQMTRAIQYLEQSAALEDRGLLAEVIVDWIDSHPLASLLIAAYPLWIVVCLLIFWLRPMVILPINRALGPLDYKLPSWLGGMTVPLRFLLVIGFLNYRPRVLDAWVAAHVGAARERFDRIRTVSDRRVHIEVPAILDGTTLPELTGKDLRPCFRKRLACLLIWGEGGAGKTSLACQVGKWAMAELPEARLSPRPMLPVLIEQDLDVAVAEGKDALTEAIGRQLQILIDAPEPIPDSLLDRLLRQRRLLVIVDHLSEMSESTRDKIQPAAATFPVNALVVTSRLEESLGGIAPAVLRPLRIAGNRLSSFMEAYLTQRQTRALFDDSEFFDACARLSAMVGSREITLLLAKLYAEQMIAAKQSEAEQALPDNIPDLMLSYLNELNHNVTDERLDDRSVHRDAKAAAWACVKQKFRPEAAPRDDILAALGGGDAESRLAYLEDRLRLIETISPAKDRCRLLLDPLAEYLAALFIVEDFAERSGAWRDFLAQAGAMPGAPAAIAGFLLAVRDCCLARRHDLDIPSFLPNALAELAYAGSDEAGAPQSRVA